MKKATALHRMGVWWLDRMVFISVSLRRTSLKEEKK